MRSLHAPLRPFFSRASSWTSVCVAVVALAGCGGEEEEPPVVEPPPPATVEFDATDPCSGRVPRPTDLFFDGNGRTERAACPLPTDPVDAVDARVAREERAPVDPEIFLPFESDLQVASLSSTVSFALQGGDATGLVPFVLLEQTGTSTAGAGWRTVPFEAQVSAGGAALLPARRLNPGRAHVVVATRALRDIDGGPLGPHPAVTALVGAAPVEASAFEGLDDAGAARLERMRTQLRPALAVLASATPPIRAGDIVSVHVFTTDVGADLLPRLVARYDAAIAAGTYRYEIQVDRRGIPPAEIFGPGVPAQAYPNVGSFVRGRILAPRLLGEDLRMRADWDRNAETVAIPFLLSIPRNAPDGGLYPVAVQVVGFGRSRLDARALADAMGGGPRGSALAIELRCHGDRSPGADGQCTENRSEAEVASLVDIRRNNGNPELAENSPDGIPDDSGVGFFPGDPLQLRDTQIAAMLEILHVVASVRQRESAWDANMITLDRQRVHLVAQGATALPAAAAAAFADNRVRPVTLQFPSGGARLEELVLGSATAQRARYDSELPEGVQPDQARTIFQRVSRLFAPFDVSTFGPGLRERYTRVGQPAPGILLAHSSSGQPGVTQVVSAAARQALVSGIGLPTPRVSQHRATCDNFYVFQCRSGDEPAILQAARAQIATFVNSSGLTVTEPAR